MREKIQIEGMKCAGCVSKVEKALQSLPGVEKVEVDLVGRQAFLEGEKIDWPLVQKTLEEIGFSAKLPLRQWQIQIEGMKCAGCVSKVEKALQSLPGVEKVEVDLVHQKARLEGLPHLRAEELLEAIESTGFRASLVEDGQRREDEEEQEDKELRQKSRQFWSALVLSLLVMLLSMVVPPFPYREVLVALLSGVVVFGLGFSFFWNTLLRAPRGSFDMDTLIALGSGAAYGYSLYLFWQGSHHAYFDGAAMIVMFVLLGRYLEKRALAQSRKSMRSLLESRPKEATLLEGEKRRKVPVEEVKPGMVLAILPGEVVPVDCEILEGEGHVNEAMFTGEPLPVWRRPKDVLKGGTISVDGAFRAKALHTIGQSYISQIIELVERAQSSKAPVQRIADRVAGVFVPIVLTLGGLTFLAHYFFGGLSATQALLPAVAVLLIACPCTLGLATPVAITVAMGKAAQMGFVFRDAESLELLSRVDLLCLDKTGTITEGKAQVRHILPLEASLSEREVLQIAASLETRSEHPLGKAILEAWGEEEPLEEVTEFRYVPGKGVTGVLQGHKYLLGKKSWLKEEGVELGEARPEELQWEKEGHTLLHLARDKTLIALLALSDSLKEGVAETLTGIRQMGVEVLLLTGDRRGAAEYVAKLAGIAQWEAELLPHEKLEKLKALKETHTVAMVGDGVNDAPALSEAHVGIAISSGTDVAVETASVIFFSPRFAALWDLFYLARKSWKVIQSNLFFAFFYNLLAIPIAALGLLSPTIAALAMSLSSVSVVTNSNRLRWVSPPSTRKKDELHSS